VRSRAAAARAQDGAISTSFVELAKAARGGGRYTLPMERLSPSLAPYLFYADVQRAAQFMRGRGFGFRLVFTSPDPQGGLAHAQLAHEAGLIMIGHAGGGGLGMVKRADALGALHAGVYVFVADVDAHCARAKSAGAKVLEAPTDRPWGDRMYCALDPEGQVWMFAKPIAKISKATT
jgi:uncharacterized glyoxalase superfamily protein PhnB